MVKSNNSQAGGGPLKLVIVGAGGIAQAYAQAIGTTEEVELAAVVDVNLPAASAMAQAAGNAVAFESVDRLLASDVQFDAAMVATPPSTHPEVCCQLLDSKVHVLCEKPMSIDMEGALEMLESAERSGSILTMASKFRYVDDVRLAKELLEQGEIGDVVLFENSFTGFVDMSSRWNSNPAISGGGVLIDNGTHSLDLARYFLGPIDDVQVVEGKRTQELAVEETVAINLRSRDGAMGNIDLSWTINKELPTYITLHGSEGTIALGWRESKWKKHGGEWQKFGKGYDKVEAFRNQLENFARAINGEEPLVITVKDGLASVRAVEAAYASLAQNPWISVKSIERPFPVDTRATLHS